MSKIVKAALEAKAKVWTFEAKAKATKIGHESPRGQGLASRITSLLIYFSEYQCKPADFDAVYGKKYMPPHLRRRAVRMRSPEGLERTECS